MTDSNETHHTEISTDSVTATEPAADAFAALSDPLRVDIIQALASHHRANSETPTAQFSTLRKAVGDIDSGRFRYHLNQLRDVFVEKEDNGYRLTYAGQQIVTALIAGTYTDRTALSTVELDSQCGVCGSTACAHYEDGILSVSCKNDHPLFVWSLPPNTASNSDLKSLVSLATTLAYHSYELVTEGTCSECYSSVERSIRSVDEAAGQQYRFTATCGSCGAHWDVPVGFALLGQPQIEALYHRLGRPIRDGYWWECDFVSDSIRCVQQSTEPLRVELSVDYEFEIEPQAETGGFRAIIGESGSVVDLDCWHGSPSPLPADSDRF